jgi:RNA polymerase sigma-70 factor, ECF subfamily
LKEVELREAPQEKELTLEDGEFVRIRSAERRREAMPPAPLNNTPAPNASIWEDFCVRSAIQGRERALLWFWRNIQKEQSKSRGHSDAEIAIRLREQDEESFLELYDRHGRTVYRFLVHMTGSAVLAEELTQEVFVAILDAMWAGTMERFDPARGTLEGYLLGIARNLARGELRRSRRHLSLDGAPETPDGRRLLETLAGDSRAQDLLALVLAESELRALHRAILELPVHYREAIVLCGLAEKSYQEAAALLGVSEGTIASRMNRAKGLLAAKLRKSQSDEVRASAG